jgi:hypothetical protein
MSSKNKVTLPKPIPLKGYLADDGRTQVWLCDQLSVHLNRNIGDDYFSRVLNGRRNGLLRRDRQAINPTKKGLTYA